MTDAIKSQAILSVVNYDREAIRAEHAEWSCRTFGNVGPIGPLTVWQEYADSGQPKNGS